MQLTDQHLIHQHTGIQKGACERIARYYDEGALLLIDLISNQKYSDLLSADEDDPDRLIASRAASYLCVYAAMPFLNLRPTDLGGFSKVIGYGERTEELMSMHEISKYQQVVWSRVTRLVKGLINEQPKGIFQGNSFGFMAVGGSE